MDIQEFEQYLQSKEKKHVIFDFDETITTLHVDWVLWEKQVRELTKKYDAGGVVMIGATIAETQNLYIVRYGEAFRDELTALNYNIEKDTYTGHTLVSSSLSLIATAKKYAEVYVWTSNDWRTVLPIVQELGIEKMFSKIITRNDVARVKPDPHGFDLIYAEGVDRSEYLMIGDSAADSGAAKNAGIDFINIRELE